MSIDNHTKLRGEVNEHSAKHTQARERTGVYSTRLSEQERTERLKRIALKRAAFAPHKSGVSA